MGKVDRWAKKADVEVLDIGGEHLVRIGDALRLLDVLSTSHVRIVGIEGFRLTGGRLEMDMTAITTDWSKLDPSASIEAARRFVGAVYSPDLFLEIAVEDLPAGS